MAQTQPHSLEGVASARIPASVTALGITAIAFSSLGILGAMWGALGLVMQRQAAEMMREMDASNPDSAADRMMEPMLAMQEQMVWLSVVDLGLSGMAAIAMGAAGIVVLLRSARTPTMGPALLAASAALAILSTACAIYIQHAMMSSMGDMMSGVMSDPSGAAAAGPMMEQMLTMQRALSYGCVGGWLLIKLSFVTWAALHLRSPEIAVLFGGPTIIGSRGD